MRAPLTDRQREVFNFILKHWEIKNRCPSLREIAEGELDGKQLITRTKKQSVHALIDRLHGKGWLKTDHFRNVTFWRIPEDLTFREGGSGQD
jgi:SOS-response transcriptional repressor LexA